MPADEARHIAPKVTVNGKRRITDETWSGLDIAHWFIEEHVNGGKNSYHGCDGIDLPGCEASEFTNYSYLWVHAAVDLDMDGFWLIEVRTNGDEDETRDHLFVALHDGKVECEWLNQPIALKAGVEAHRDHLEAGLEWFVQGVMMYVRGESWR